MGYKFTGLGPVNQVCKKTCDNCAILEDLEDYFNRLDARRAAATEALNEAALPSAERFDDADLAQLARNTVGPSGTGENITCAICLVMLVEGDAIVVLPCAAAHRFHTSCVDGWLRRNVTCPLCRVDVREIVRNRREEVQSVVQGVALSPRAFGYTRDGGIISRYEPRPPPELPRPAYIAPELRTVAELVEINYPDRGTARVWRVPR